MWRQEGRKQGIQPTWRVLDLRHTLLTSTFAEQDTGCRSMGEDVAADWLSTICTGEEGAGSRVALDLVGEEHRDVELWRR